MISASISSYDPRSAWIYKNGVRVACVVFIDSCAIPATQRAYLLNGFKSFKQAKDYCANMGLAWFKTIQG